MIIKGFMMPTDSKVPSTQENDAIMKWLMEYWHLGPEVGSDAPGSNKDYWSEMAKVWNIAEEEARRRLCANCEYFNDSPKMLRAMESIKHNKFDETGGGRGFCRKFDFICHNLRTCQAWEGEEEMDMEGED